jgi:hypothetical protein
MAVDLAQIIPPLVEAKVDFVVIGGMPAILRRHFACVQEHSHLGCGAGGDLACRGEL